jgi:uncharacterized protein DUF4340
MNFKTTIVLLIVLVAAVGIFFYTGTNQPKPEQTGEPNPVQGIGAKIMSINALDVVRMTVTDATGKQTSLEKTDAGWRIRGPFDAPSPSWEARAFIGAYTDVRSTGQPEENASQSGLDKPAYHIEFQTSDGKTTQLNLGNKTSLGDTVYAQVDGGDVNLIPASLEDNLPTIADQLRDRHLFNTQTLDAQQIRITYGDTQIALAKNNGVWQITQPEALPGDASQIAALLSNMLSVQATDFVSADSPDLAYAGFDHPTLQISASADAPTTQSATTQPSGAVTLTIGAPTTLSRDAYFARSSDGVVAKVSADILDKLRKTPLDLRDRTILSIAPADVTQISLLREAFAEPAAPAASPPAPSAKRSLTPSNVQKILLIRRPVAAQPISPSPGTTRPATVPSAPISAWEFPDEPNVPVDDSKVAALLAQLQPLRAEDFRAAPSSGVPMQRYVLVISTRSSTTRLELNNYVQGAMPIGSYNGLYFDISSDLQDMLNVDYHLITGPPMR